MTEFRSPHFLHGLGAVAGRRCEPLRCAASCELRAAAPRCSGLVAPSGTRGMGNPAAVKRFWGLATGRCGDTHKQAGRKALRSQGHQLRSCHETKRFRILATLKQGNKSMYSNTSGYVHMGLGLDWGKVITGQKKLSPNSYPNPRSDPLSGWWGRGLKHNPCSAQSGP